MSELFKGIFNFVVSIVLVLNFAAGVTDYLAVGVAGLFMVNYSFMRDQLFRKKELA
ncbi:MAG: hypothetical protein GY765_20260 [bacterium]|nr:hypothetical protein [bacterium]